MAQQPTGREAHSAMTVTMVDLRPLLGSEAVRQLLDHMEYPPDVRDAKTAAVVRWYREHPQQPILGALRGGALVGFIALRLDASAEAEIRQIAVHSRHRRHGIGRQMITAVWETYNLRKLCAETDRNGVGFYRRLGFTTHSLGEKYPGTERFSCTLTNLAQRPSAADRVQSGG